MFRFLTTAAVVLLVACASTPSAPPAAVADLAPTGKLRAAINFGNPILATRDAATGEPRGVSVDLSRELGRRLGVPVELVTFDAAGKAFEALKSGVTDIGFLAIEPVRAADVDFTAPYVLIEGTYMVPKDSALKVIEDVDRSGVRIAVNKGSAYDLYLTRTLKHATLMRHDTDGIGMFKRDKLEAAGGVRQPLESYARQDPSVRVMAGRFMAIQQAMGMPKGRGAAPDYLRGFVEEMKASGFVADALKRSNQPDAVVAPKA